MSSQIAPGEKTRLFLRRFCGEAGIRTLDTGSGIPVFETGAFNHSATSPMKFFNIEKNPGSRNRGYHMCQTNVSDSCVRHQFLRVRKTGRRTPVCQKSTPACRPDPGWPSAPFRNMSMSAPNARPV